MGNDKDSIEESLCETLQLKGSVELFEFFFQKRCQIILWRERKKMALIYRMKWLINS